MINKKDIKLYHGSPQNGLTEILCLNNTGATGTTDGDRENFRDVVFLTTSQTAARRYAGQNGTVYQVVAENSRLYSSEYARRVENKNIAGKSKCLQKKKIKSLVGDVNTYVADRAFVI